MKKLNLFSLGPVWLVAIIPAVLSSCAYQNCPNVKDGYINVHLVPHSHDDMGWLKTVDQYYYGANNSIQLASVQYILDSVVEELQKDPSRRFIYVETGFFWRWWTNQSPDKQEIVKSLVQSRQLEFINGGWCMNDEATTHYNEIIDQMSLGLMFLNETFGDCGLPRVAWQIDPFGHSREQASIFARMGFDGLFFGRLDYQDKRYRELRKNMETIWSGSPKNLGKYSWLFTGVLFNGYNPPDGFCWDVTCNDNPIMDDPKLLGYNVDDEVNQFVKSAKEWASVYKTNHILMTMGSDFQYMSSHMWFKNLDKLISYINTGEKSQMAKINLIYSTPSCYLKEVNNAGISLEVKRDDFFPYASNKHSFWTGYFTSRPALKFYVHQTNNFLQACKHFAASADDTGEEGLKKVFELAEPMAVAQHHDAISGTAKQHVTFDYALRLSIGIKACEDVIGTGIKKLWINNGRDNIGMIFSDFRKELKSLETFAQFNLNQDRANRDVQFCHVLNISSCHIFENAKSVLMHVYNPLAREVKNVFLRLPVSSDERWTAFGSEGAIQVQQIPLPHEVISIPGRQSIATSEIIVPIKWLPPMTLQTIRLSITNDAIPEVSKFLPKTSLISFTNNRGLGLTLDRNTGLIHSISRLNASNRKMTRVKLSQNFYYYTGMNGVEGSQASGAYIFRPRELKPNVISNKASYTVYKGRYVTEIQQKFSDWSSQVIRLYDDSDSIEFEYLVGPIPIDDNVGKEVITKYTSDLKTEGVFYTDANGREILKRKRNFRPTWNYEINEPVAGNYYPVNSRFIITDGGKELDANSGTTLILLNDRSQGGTSLNDGEIELMLHRRLLRDDNFGVGEALNETAYGEGLVIRGKHWLFLAGGETGVPTSIHRPVAQEIYRSPILAFQDISSLPFDIFPNTNEILGSSYSGNRPILALELPRNIHLLTYEKRSASTRLLRLEHIYETGEDAILSKKSFVPIQALKNAFGFDAMREVSLGGNQWMNETNRMPWKTKMNEKLTLAEIHTRIRPYIEGDTVIEFEPMEIKSFLLIYNN